MNLARMQQQYFLFLSGASLGFALLGCGGPQTSSPAAAAAADAGGGTKSAQDADAPKVDDKRTQAESAFGALSEELAKKTEGVDSSWLEMELKKILAIDPQYNAARYNLAVLIEQRGDREGARKALERIHDDDPNFAPAAENLAAMAVRDGNVAEASAIYKRIISKDPTNITSRLGLARLLLREKKYKKAIGLCRYVLQRKADAIEAFRVLAQSYKAINDIPMAELIIGRGLKVAAKDIELHTLLAEILLGRDDLSAGVSKLKEIIRMDPKGLTARARLASIAMAYRDFGNASQQYEAILKDKKDNWDARVGLAVSYKGLGRFDQAERIYSDLLRERPGDAEVLWNMSVLYHRNLRRYDDAIAYYQKFKGAAPSGDKRVSRVAKLIAKVQRAKSDLAAEQARMEAERKRQEAIAAVCNAVQAGKPFKKLTEAIGGEQERIESAWQLFTGGQTAMQAGDIAGGEQQILCGLVVVPDTAQARAGTCAPMHVLWTQILYELGRSEDAMVSIDKALACDDANPDAQLIKQQLTELMGQGAAGG